jgi:GTP-binding protein EngB required for normal cell division
MSDISGLLDALDLALARGQGVVPAFELAVAEEEAGRIRSRRGYLGDTLVLAIAGGTGSGKSSLLNALAGQPIASVSRIRPHTDEPLAWVPSDAGDGLGIVLDRLRIERRVEQDELPDLAVLDLPDVDSFAEWHRRMVEDLLPEIDVVIWVFDPEKYHDRLVHDEFLGPLAAYREQFIFVLNQIDRLNRGEAGTVLTDLQRLLNDAGYDASATFALAADPPDGAPTGVEELRRHLAERMDGKRLAVTKLIGDVQGSARRVGRAAKVWTGSSLDFERRWDVVKEAAIDGLLPEADPGLREDCLCRIEDFVAAIAVEAGGVPAGRIRETFPIERIKAVLGEATAAAAASAGSEKKKRRRRKKSPDPRREPAAARLDSEIGGPLRELLWDRSQFGATLGVVGIEAAEAEVRLLGG